jgi:hypothetical protein
MLHAQATATATVAGYQRRADEWEMLANTTNLELAQVADQIGSMRRTLGGRGRRCTVQPEQRTCGCRKST